MVHTTYNSCIHSTADLADKDYEMVIHGGEPLTQVARELGVSEYRLHLWRKARLSGLQPAEVDGQMMSPQEMVKEIRRQEKEIEWLRQQREILKKP